MKRQPTKWEKNLPTISDVEKNSCNSNKINIQF